MYQEVDGGGMSQSSRALRDDAEHRGSTLSEVARYLEQMSPEESEGLWTELDKLATRELAA